MRLTQEQQAVVDWDGGHVVVEAVAGSGKTTVLVERNLALLERGVAPAGLLSLVYNKDAQIGFEGRLKRRLGGEGPPVRTFHAQAYLMLKRLARMGVVQPATLVSGEGELRRMLGDALRAAASPKERSLVFDLVDDFGSFVTIVKSGFEEPVTVLRDRKYGPDTAMFVKAFAIFEERRHQNGLLTFDDMLLDVVHAIGNDDELWGTFNSGLAHLICDETQDLNAVQFRMMQGLTAGGALLMAVGDPGQAIYGFRGASPNFISSEIPRFYGADRLTLSTTFRYGHRTALLASHGLSRNKVGGRSVSVAGPGTPNTDVVFVKSLEAHAPTMLKAAFAEGADPSVAVLGRRFSDLVAMEIALLQAGIPYFVLGRTTTGLQREVAGLMGVLGWMRGDWGGYDAVAKSRMSAAMWRYPTLYLTRAVLEDLDKTMAAAVDGKEMLRKVRAYARALRSTDYRSASNIEDRLDALEAVIDLPASIEPAMLLRLYRARAKIDEVVRRSATNEDRAQDTIQGIDAVLNVIEGTATAGEVMTLMRKLEQQEAKAPDGPAVVLTSIHRAKGLEWDTVMLASVGEMTGEMDVEEERRLTYVAVTRAKRQLWIEAPWLGKDDIALNEVLPPRAPKRMPRWLEEAEVVKSLVVGEALEKGLEIVVGGEVVKRYVGVLDALESA